MGFLSEDTQAPARFREPAIEDQLLSRRLLVARLRRETYNLNEIGAYNGVIDDEFVQ